MQKPAPCGDYKQRQRAGERKAKNNGNEMRETVLHGMYPQLWRAKNIVDSRDAAI